MKASRSRHLLCCLGTLIAPLPAHAILTGTINANNLSIVHETPTSGFTISLADLQAVITARNDLTTAAVLTKETAENTMITLADELSQGGAKFSIAGAGRWSRGDGAESSFLPTSSGSRFGFVSTSETWTLSSENPGQGATHFGFISRGKLTDSHLSSVVATFSDGTRHTISSQGSSPGTDAEFVGIAAPEGATIVSVVVNEPAGGNWMPYDDVVIVVPPRNASRSLWVGGGADANWTTAANWEGGTIPPDGADVSFDGSLNPEVNNDQPAGRFYSGIRFAAGAGSFILSGNPLDPGAFLLNDSVFPQTFDLPLSLGSGHDILLDARNGPLTFGGPLSGNAGVIKAGGQSVTLFGANTFTGILQVRAGTLNLEGDQSGATGGIRLPNDASPTLNLAGGATASIGASAELYIGNETGSGTGAPRFNVDGTLTSAGPLRVLRGGNLTLNGILNQSGPAAVSGLSGYGARLTVNAGGELHYTGGTDFSLVSSASNDNGRSRLALNGGLLSTTRPLTGQEGAAFPSLLILGNGGTLRPGEEMPDLAFHLIILIQDGEAVIDTNGRDTTVSAPVKSSIPAIPAGTGSFVKAGAGTLALTSETNDWEGGTIVRGGTLVLARPSLSDNAGVEIEGNSVLRLDFVGPDTVSSLVLDGVAQESGIWGGPGSGADHTSPRLSGTGLLRVGLPPEAALSISAVSNGSITVTWTGGTLQTSTDLINWGSDFSAVSPLTEPVSDRKFYRVIP